MGRLIAGICAIGLGIFFIITVWGGHFQSKKVINEGGRAIGQVIDKKISRHRTGTTRHRHYRTDHDVYYNFKTKNGETIKSHYAISKDKWNGLKIGDTIEIAYDLDKPNYNFPLGEGSLVPIGMPIALSFFGLIPIAIGSILIAGLFGSLKGNKK